MKWINLIIFNLLLFLKPSLAQQDYFVYHSMINRAEEKISTSDFVGALEIYDSTFSQFKYVFVKEFVIAAQLAAYLNDRNRCINYIYQAMKGGYKVHCLKSFYYIEQLLNDLDWEEIDKNAVKCRSYYLSTIDWDLNVELSKRHRAMDDAYNTPWETKIVCENYDFIQNLMNGLVFPSAKNIGIDDQSLDPLLVTTRGWKMLSDCTPCNNKVILTLAKTNNIASDFGLDFLLEAIRSGDLHPREIGKIYRISSRGINCNGENFSSGDTTNLLLYCASSSTEAVKNQMKLDRQKIGMIPFDVEQKLVDFQLSTRFKILFGIIN